MCFGVFLRVCVLCFCWWWWFVLLVLRAPCVGRRSSAGSTSIGPSVRRRVGADLASGDMVSRSEVGPAVCLGDQFPGWLGWLVGWWADGLVDGGEVR